MQDECITKVSTSLFQASRFVHKSLSMDLKTKVTPSTFVRNLILQVIAHVRKRKARPDLVEICRQLKRRQNWPFEETQRCVNELLDLGTILRVEYKNNFSYRDAMDLQKGHVSGQISNTEGLVVKLQSAIDGVIENRNAGLDGASDGRDDNYEIGASAEEIEAWFESEHEKRGDICTLRGNPLTEVLVSEVHRNTLIKKKVDGVVRYHVGNRVSVQPRDPPRIDVPDLPMPEENQETQEEGKAEAETSPDSIDDKRQRPPSQRKRRLKYDDEMYELPPIKKLRKPPQTSSPPTSGTTTTTSCSSSQSNGPEEAAVEPKYRLATMFRKCNEEHQMENPSRHAGQEDEMLECCECHMKAHPDCLSYSDELLSKIDRVSWRCVTCKKCTCCDQLLRRPSPLTCSGCDLAYHKNCHKPVVRKKAKENWLCMKCTGTEALMTSKASALPEANGVEPVPYASSSSSVDDGAEEPAEEECLQQEESAVEDSRDSLPAASAVKSAERGTPFPPTPRDSPSIDEDDDEFEGIPHRGLPMKPPARSQERRIGFDGRRFPDPARWTTDQVYNYIVGLPGDKALLNNWAEVLKAEGVDGEALVLLKRDDILTRFSLKVGPALKLHRLIQNMTTNGNANKYEQS